MMAAARQRRTGLALIALLAVAGGYTYCDDAAVPRPTQVEREPTGFVPAGLAPPEVDHASREDASPGQVVQRSVAGRVIAAATGNPLGHATVFPSHASASVSIDKISGRFVVVPGKDAALTEVDMRFRCPGHEDLELTVALNVQRLDLGDIPLRSAGSLTGAVLGTALPTTWSYEIQATLMWPAEGASSSVPRPGKSAVVHIARCGPDNKFSLNGLASGRWKLSITTPFLPQSETLIEIETGVTAWVDLQGPAAEDLLAGTVIDDRGNQGCGVWLTAEDGSATGGSVTDRHGRFLLCRRPDRRSVVEVRLRGGDPNGTAAIRKGLAQNVTAWGEHDARIVFLQRAAHLVRVRATDTQAPVDFSLLALYGKVGIGPRMHGPVAGSGGLVSLSGVPAGPCLLRVLPAASSGLAEAEVYCEIPEAGGGETSVVLEPGIDRVGSAARSDGQPLAGRTVRFFETTEPAAAESQLREILGLPAALRQLATVASARDGAFKTRLPNRVGLKATLDEPSGQQPIRLQPVPLHPEPIRLTEQVGATVHGRLAGESFLSFVQRFNSKCSPAARWSLVFFGAEGQRREVAVGGDGSYRVNNLATSTWSVVWTGPSGSFELDRLPVSADTVIERNYDCDSHTPRRIEGVVSLDGGAAPAVELHLANERTREVVSISRASTFASLLMPGSYHVRLVLHPGSANEVWLDRSERLHVGQQPTSYVALSFTQRHGVIEIVNHDGQPAAGLGVAIDLERSAGHWRTYKTDSNGRLTLSCAPDGEFRLTTTGENPTTFATCRIDRSGQVLRVTAP